MRRFVGVLIALGLLALIAGLVLPFLLPFTSSGTLSVHEAAAESVEDSPTFLFLDDIDLYVERTAARSPQTDTLIVVLHGFGANAETWRETAQGLAEFGDVLAYDRPGFGFTERPRGEGPPDPYGVDGQVALLRTLLEAEADGREVVLLGHSAGGTLAAEYALRYPEEVDAVVLVAPAILTTGGTPRWLRPIMTFPPVDQLGPRIAGFAGGRAERLLEASWYGPDGPPAEIRARYTAPFAVRGWEQGLWRVLRAPGTSAIAEDPGALEVPAQVITGADDRVVPTDESIELAGILGLSTVTVIPNSGHVPHEETPEAFLDAVRAGWPLPPPSER